MAENKTLVIGGAFTLGKAEEWEAPDGATAQRWKDEMTARGGVVEVCASSPCGGGPTRWFVRVFHNITASSPS